MHSVCVKYNRELKKNGFSDFFRQNKRLLRRGKERFFMKYLTQLLIIFTFTFLGEALSALLPLPIPASIYGLVLLFLALKLKLVRTEQVEDVGSFFISLLPILFVAPMVDLMDCWETLRSALLPSLAVIVVSTVFVFYISGRVTELVLRKQEEKHHD